MFFIIWGTKVRQEELGTVADWCPYCCRVRRFTVADHFEVPHIYYISLGRGSWVQTTRECWRCTRMYRCRPRDYAEFVPEEEVEGLPLRELVTRTNPRLEERGPGP